MHLPDTRPIYISSRLSTTTPTAAPPRHRWEAPTAMRRVARRGGVVHLRVGGGRFVSLAGARCTTPPPAPDFSSSTHEPTSPQHCSGESAHAHLRGAGALRTIVVYVRPVLEHQSGQRRVQSESNQ